MGKTAIATGLARETEAVHLRIDSIEQALRDCNVTISGPEGYLVGYAIAEDILRLGRIVIADSVNPVEVTRTAGGMSPIERARVTQRSKSYVPTRMNTNEGWSHG